MRDNYKENWASLMVPPSTSLLEAIKKMDEVRCKLLLVLDSDGFIGLVSIGDIQRAIIKDVALDQPVSSVMRSDIVVCNSSDSEEFIRSEMLRCRAAFMPVLNEDNKLTNVIFWEDILTDNTDRHQKEELDLPVIIMSGGLGSRLRPLTNVLPKPLLPFNDKTIIETIIDRFVQAGCKEFHLSLNYKASLIKHYFAELEDRSYSISTFEEKTPMGTAGSLSLIADSLKTPFFVSNCDIVIDQELDEVWHYHCENKNELTIIAALKHIKLAYGSLITGEDGLLQELSEKPEWVFKVNSGVYLLEPHLLEMVPKNQFYNMTDLIDAIVARGGRVGVFPVSERSWTDIGNWEDYSQLLARGSS